MNLLRLVLYVPRLLWFGLRVILFRAYLLLFFIARPAGPVLACVLLGLALAFSWPFSGPLIYQAFALLREPLLQWAAARPPSDGLRQLVELFAPLGTEFTTAVALLALHWLFSWLQWSLIFILPAFPFPRRPLPPVWFWLPPEHRIERANVRIVVKKLPLRYWDQRLDTLAARLKPELQMLLEPEPQALPAPATAIGSPELAEVPSKTSQQEPQKRSKATSARKPKPSAPWVPPNRHAAE